MNFRTRDDGVTPDYLNEFAGHEIIIETEGIEKGQDSIRRNPIKTYMNAGNGRCAYRITEANKRVVARLDEIADTLNSYANNGSLTRKAFSELYNEAKMLVNNE